MWLHRRHLHRSKAQARRLEHVWVHCLHSLFRVNTHTSLAQTHTCFHNPQAALHKQPPPPRTNPAEHSRNSVGLSFTLSPTVLSFSYALLPPPSLFSPPAVRSQSTPHLHTPTHFTVFTAHILPHLRFMSLSFSAVRFFFALPVFNFVDALLNGGPYLCICRTVWKLCFSSRWARWQTTEVLSPEVQEVWGYQGVSHVLSQIEGLGSWKTKGPSSSAGSGDMDGNWAVWHVVF